MISKKETTAKSRIGTNIGSLTVDYTFPTGRGVWEYGCSCESCNRAGLVLSWKEVQVGECVECAAGLDSSPVETRSWREDRWTRIREEERAMSRKYAELEALFEEA